MTEANPIILDPSESLLEEQAKGSSELANSSDDTRNEVESFTKPIPPEKRLQATRWFLTYPQTTTTKEEASDRLRQHVGLNHLGIKGFLIAQEKHKDNNSHLHIALWLNKKLSTRDRNYFDFVCKKHGNYTIMKSGYASVNYLRWV